MSASREPASRSNEDYHGSMTGTTVADHAPDLSTARTFLFVPGDRPDRFAKAAASGADVVIVDLEDAVSEERKDYALGCAVDWLVGHRAVVRVEEANSPRHASQLTALASTPGLIAFVVPKAASASDLAIAASHARPVLPLVESAAGLRAVDALASAPGAARLLFGNLDFAADIGLPRTSDEALAFPRASLAVACAAAGLPGPVDGVHDDLHDEQGLRRTTAAAVSLGLTGKLCIHPRQVAPIHDELRPSAAQLAWARSILSARTDAVGVVAGAMVDRPQVLRAAQLVARAERGA